MYRLGRITGDLTDGHARGILYHVIEATVARTTLPDQPQSAPAIPPKGIWQDHHGRFTAGNLAQSLGPRQRLVSYVRQHTRSGERMIDVLIRIMEDPEQRARDRIDAARELLDRGYGQARASIDITSGGEPLRLDPRSLSDADLAALLSILARQSAATVDSTARELSSGPTE